MEPTLLTKCVLFGVPAMHADLDSVRSSNLHHRLSRRVGVLDRITVT